MTSNGKCANLHTFASQDEAAERVSVSPRSEQDANLDLEKVDGANVAGDGEATFCVEIPWIVSEQVASWRRIIESVAGDARGQFARASAELLELGATFPAEPETRLAIVDALFGMARHADIGDDEAQAIMAAAQPPPEAIGKPPSSMLDERPGAIVAAPLISPSQWPQEAPPPVDWLAAGRIPRGDVTTLHGDGGAGKTDIALRLAANVARGAIDWLGHEIANGPVVLVSGEEPEREVRRRLWLHAERDGYSFADLAKLHQWFPGPDGDTVLATPDFRAGGRMQPTRLMNALNAAITQGEPVLVIVDNVAATFAGNQNDRVAVRSYVNLWRAIARGPSRPAVLLLDHPSLSGLTSGTGRGGSMDWRNAVRCALYLRPADEKAEADQGIRILETVKSNYGLTGNPLRLRWAEGGLQLEQALSSLHRLAKDQECEETFLRLLDERNAQARPVSDRHSAMYAPKIFAGMEGSSGFARDAFAGAMNRLFEARRIVLKPFGPPSRGQVRIERAPITIVREAAE